MTPSFYAGTNAVHSAFVQDKGLRYPLLLQPTAQGNKKQLPDLDQVFDRLFLRKEFIPETRVSANMLLVSFTKWFLDDVFMTEPNTEGVMHRFPTKESDGPGLEAPLERTFSLKTLYGTDTSRERALRTFQHGILKSGPDGGLPSLPQIREEYPTFTMICGWNRADSSCYADESFYATGHERSNFQPGHLLFTELLLREHNELAQTLHEQNPSWDDELIYQTARLILSHVLAKIILNEYISNAVSTARDFVELGYNPDHWRRAAYDKMPTQPSPQRT